MKCNQTRPVFELGSPSPFRTTVTITPQAPYVCMYVCMYVLRLAKIMEITPLEEVYLGVFFYLAVNKLIRDKAQNTN